jgi:FkbM family methyltransferase
MSITVLYGGSGKYLDVTGATHRLCYRDGMIRIPGDDHERAKIYGDPLLGVVKEIIIRYDNTETIFKHGTIVSFPVENFPGGNFPEELYHSIPLTPKGWVNSGLTDVDAKISYIHRNIHIVGGNMSDEYPEQQLATEFIPQDAKVLELGSNIGRNTLVIASLITDESQFVTLECDPKSVAILTQNRDNNGMKFHIEPSALSARRLFLLGWDSFIEENKPDGSVEISTITWPDLQKKYDVKFDTVVADCEGALYYILQDFPEMLDDIKLLIMENDYRDINQKIKVDEILRNHGFNVKKQVRGGWGPCYNFFFEAWSKL